MHREDAAEPRRVIDVAVKAVDRAIMAKATRIAKIVDRDIVEILWQGFRRDGL